MSRILKSNAAILVFAAITALWAVLFFWLSEKLAAAEEERDRLAAQEREKSEELERLKREAAQLSEYTDKLLKDPEFVEREARERIGVGGEGEIIIRADEN